MFMTMKYQCLSFIYVLCFSMSRFWVLCHLPLALPPFFCVIILLATVNGLAFPGSLDEAMMSGALMTVYITMKYMTMINEFYMQFFTIS